MIILLYNEGQMCNQLLSIASAYTLGLEKKDNVTCPLIKPELIEKFQFKRDMML